MTATTPPALLPLPEPARRNGQQMSYDGYDKVHFDCYDNQQMRDYAARCIAADRAARSAEMAALREDAERYRWLRTYPHNIDACVYGPTYEKNCGGLLRRDEYLDHSIDAARSLGSSGGAGGGGGKG